MHENTSIFEEQRFSSIFTGEEFFIVDHVVKDRRVFPEVAHLEMARVATELAAGMITKENRTNIQLKKIVWAEPIIVNEQETQVHIGLFPKGNGEIAFKIYTEADTGNDALVVHSQGMATLSAPDNRSRLDLCRLQTTRNQRHLNWEQFYETFKTMGIDYGSRPSRARISLRWQESGDSEIGLAFLRTRY